VLHGFQRTHTPVGLVFAAVVYDGFAR
jgi:hypothetical protein